jgi:hypothetical protein
MILSLSDPLQRGWIITLVILWAGLLFGGFVFGKTDSQQEQRMPTWTRIGSSCMLVIAAWSWCAFTRHDSLAPFNVLFAVGITLGLVGDIALAGLFRIKQSTLAGLAAFGAGHIAYIAAFGIVAAHLGDIRPGLFTITLIAWLLVGALGWYIVVFRNSQATLLHRLALLYTLLLAGVAGVATALAVQAHTFVPAAIGATLFFCSDLILAAQLFRNLHFPFIGDAIWFTYGPGQLLILTALNSALFLLR